MIIFTIITAIAVTGCMVFPAVAVTTYRYGLLWAGLGCFVVFCAAMCLAPALGIS